MKVKSESEVARSCPTLHDPMDGSLPGSSVHGIFQARVLEWGTIVFSKENIWLDPKDLKDTKHLGLHDLTLIKFFPVILTVVLQSRT